MARIKVTRTIVIEGKEDWVGEVLKRSWVSPEEPRDFGIFGKVYELPRQMEPIIDPYEIARRTG